MTRKFSELRGRMSREARARAEAKTREMIAEMALSEIRQAVGLTQEELARKLGIKQPTLSKLESKKDMQISTLHHLIKALGGTLEIVVHLPSGDIRIKQFQESA